MMKLLEIRKTSVKMSKGCLLFLRFFEILQNFDSEIDCMTLLEGTISLLISQVNVSERAMLRFSDSCVLAFI